MSESPLAKKSLGQHWLRDNTALKAMVAAADIKPGDVVLEVGPGQGTLTDKLIAAGAEVVALEYDPELIKFLHHKYQNYTTDKIWVQEGDIRTYDFGNMADNYKIVANIPYYLTANLLRLLTDSKTHKPRSAALLVQKEVAERVAARAEKMGLTSVITQFYYEVSLGRIVEAKLFEPPPKVDSQILILNQRPAPLFPDVVEKTFFQLVKAGFSSRRKTIENALSGGLRKSKSEIHELLQVTEIPPSTRAQELSLEAWHKLYLIYNKKYG